LISKGDLLVDPGSGLVQMLEALEQQRKPITSLLGVFVEAPGLQPVQTLPKLRLSGEQAPVDRASADADRTQRL
jgi:hypothetical protein